MFPLQSNDAQCTTAGCNYLSICNITLNSGGNPLTGLAHLIETVFQRVDHDSCLPIVIDSGKSLLNTTLEGGQDRVWEWQTCTEFGFYQTCNPGSNCPFTSEPHYNNLQFYLDQCKVAYGITEEMVYEGVKETNLVYTNI